MGRTGSVTAALVVAGTIGGCLVDAPPRRPTAEAQPPPLRTLVLGNGLRVVLQQTPDFGAAAVAAGVGAGAADDPVDRRGLAHFVEHLVVQSSHAGVSLWSAVVDDRANAFTSWDETVYHSISDLGGLEQSLAVAYNAVVDPLGGVGDVVFQRQKRIVASEIRFDHVEETPADEALWAAVFSPGDPYALPVAGTVDSVAAISWADVQAFTEAHYGARNGVLAVAAPLSLYEQQKMIERVTGGTVQGALPPAPPAGAERLSIDPPRSYAEASAPVASPRLLIGWSLPSSAKSGDLASIVSRMLSGLTFALHEQDPDLSHLETQVRAGTRADLLTVRAILKEGTHAERTARLVIDEIQKGLGKLGFEFDGFESMRSFYGSELLYRQERLIDQAIDATWSTLRTGVPSYLADRGSRLSQLGPDEVLGYVRTYLSPARAHVVLLRPGEPAPEPASPPLALTQAALHAPAVPSARAAIMPAAAAARPHPLLAGLETHVLSNGLTVVLFRRPGSRFHTALLGFRGGLAQATPAGVIEAADWARRWMHQSPRLFGILHHTWAGQNETFEQLRGVGSDVSVTLKYLREQLGFSVFWPPKDFVDRVKLFERESQMPAETLSRQMERVLYGNQPLGVQPTALEIQRVTPGELNRWLSHVRQPSNSVLVIVGDFDRDEVLAAAEAQLGSWGANAAPIAPPADPPVRTELPEADRGRVIFTHQPGTGRATVRFECLLPRTTANDWSAQLIFRNGVQQALREELRENLGSTYSVDAWTSVVRGGTTVFGLSTDVDYAQLSTALARLRQAVAGPSGGFVGQTAFEETKALAIRAVQIGGASSTEWANALASEWTLSWPLDINDRLPSEMARARREDLDQIANHCRANGVVGLLGDEGRLRRAWAEVAR